MNNVKNYTYMKILIADSVTAFHEFLGTLDAVAINFNNEEATYFEHFLSVTILLLIIVTIFVTV